MRHFIIKFCLFFIPLMAFANSNELFQQANQYYRNKAYQKAKDTYLSILEKGDFSDELYLNLGNSYFKLQHYGEAIYYFEKALLLDINNEDAEKNRNYTQQFLVDKVEGNTLSFLDKITNNRIVKDYNRTAWISVLLALILTVTITLFLIATDEVSKNRFFKYSLLAFIVTTLSVTSSFLGYEAQKGKNSLLAIILEEECILYTEPNSNTEEIVLIHEGLKVRVLDTVDDWKKVKLSNGLQGWVLKDVLRDL